MDFTKKIQHISKVKKLSLKGCEVVFIVFP